MKAAHGHLVAVLILAASVGLGGCSSKPRDEEVQRAPLSPEAEQTLILGTASLLTQTYVQVVAASADAAAATTDRALQEDSLRWRINAIDRVDAIHLIPDPRVRFVALWTLIERLNLSLTTGVDQHRFGPTQAIYVKAVAALQARALEIAYASFPAKLVDQARPEIARVVKGLKGTESPGELTAAANSVVQTFLYIPMAPVSGLRGVGDTPAAINRFTDETAVVGQIVERLPERTRWQTELFLLEAEESGAIARGLKDAEAAIAEMQAMRRDFSTFVDTTQKLPDQANAMLREIMKTEPALAQDLVRIESSLKLAKETVAGADQSVQRVDGAITNARQMLGEVDKSSASLQSAAVEIRGLVADIDKLTGSPSTQPGKPDEITPAKIQSMAAELRTASVELRRLLADLREPGEMKGLEQTAGRLEQLLSKALWGVAGLIVLFFASAIGYRRLTRKAS